MPGPAGGGGAASVGGSTVTAARAQPAYLPFL